MLEVERNASISNLIGLDCLTKVGETVSVRSNPKLSSIDGLPRLTFIGGQLSLLDNPILEDLGDLESLKRLGSELMIDGSPKLFPSAVESLQAHISNAGIRCDPMVPTIPSLG